MATLLTICIIVAVVGLILVVLSVIPGFPYPVPGGVAPGISLIVVGVILYIVLALLVHPVS